MSNNQNNEKKKGNGLKVVGGTLAGIIIFTVVGWFVPPVRDKAIIPVADVLLNLPYYIKEATNYSSNESSNTEEDKRMEETNNYIKSVNPDKVIVKNFNPDDYQYVEDFDNLVRHPENYKDTKYQFTGTIASDLGEYANDGFNQYIVNVMGIESTIYVVRVHIPIEQVKNNRILPDDEVCVYGHIYNVSTESGYQVIDVVCDSYHNLMTDGTGAVID